MKSDHGSHFAPKKKKLTGGSHCIHMSVYNWTTKFMCKCYVRHFNGVCSLLKKRVQLYHFKSFRVIFGPKKTMRSNLYLSKNYMGIFVPYPKDFQQQPITFHHLLCSRYPLGWGDEDISPVSFFKQPHGRSTCRLPSLSTQHLALTAMSVRLPVLQVA